MLLAAPLQVFGVLDWVGIVLFRMKVCFLQHFAMRLVSLNVMAQSVSVYVLIGILTGQWTAQQNAISPLRWLACFFIPTMIASRGLKNGTVSTTGALAVLQIGFLLTLANLSYISCFAAHLCAAEIMSGWGEMADQRRGTSLTFAQIYVDNMMAVLIAAFHLIDLGVNLSGRWVTSQLDFSGNYTQTWLALSLIGAYSSSVKPDWTLTLVQSSARGVFMALAYIAGFSISNGAVMQAQSSLILSGLLAGLLAALLSPAVRLLCPSVSLGAGLNPMTSLLCCLLLPRIIFILDSIKGQHLLHFHSHSSIHF